MSRIIEWRERDKLTHAERLRLRTVPCGPECPCDTPKTGISIGRFDSFGVPYPDAVGVILDMRRNEWVVYVFDADSDMLQREAARYPVSEVQAIRNLPFETQLYSHSVLDEEPANG